MFIEFWPLIKKYMPDREHRIEFTAELLQLLVDSDMDPYDVEDIDPDVRAALAQADLGIDDPEGTDDDSSD